MRGGRRRAGGYARYSAGAVVGSEAPIGLSARSPPTLSSPIPLLFFPHLSRGVAVAAQIF
jgi:hypothetical protein